MATKRLSLTGVRLGSGNQSVSMSSMPRAQPSMHAICRRRVIKGCAAGSVYLLREHEHCKPLVKAQLGARASAQREHRQMTAACNSVR